MGFSDSRATMRRFKYFYIEENGSLVTEVFFMVWSFFKTRKENELMVRMIMLMNVVLVLGMVGSVNAGVCSQGDYIGGDATGTSSSCTNNPSWNPQGGGGLFFADSGNGSAGWGTRAPQRTVNGHMMSAGGTHGMLASGGDSGWLGSFGSNGGNPATTGCPTSLMMCMPWVLSTGGIGTTRQVLARQILRVESKRFKSTIRVPALGEPIRRWERSRFLRRPTR